MLKATDNHAWKPIPSKPVIILRTSDLPMMEDRDGEKAALVGIQKDCGGFSTFSCEVQVRPDRSKYWTGDVLYSIPADYFEFANPPEVPESHARNPETRRAWILCHYRDEAWQRGEFAPAEPETV